MQFFLKRLWRLTVIVFIFTIEVYGQESPYRFNFRQLSLEQGLSQVNILCIVKDAKGFMWFGTKDGLNRFDGYHFRVFKSNNEDTNSLSNNFIQALHIDEDGIIWIGTRNGLNRYDPDKQIFNQFKITEKNQQSANSNDIYAIAEDQYKRLWLGTNGGGLYIFDKTSGVFIENHEFKQTISEMSTMVIYALSFTDTNTLWIGTKGNGLYKFEFAGFQVEHFVHDPKNPKSIDNNFINIIKADHHGLIWIGTEEGLSIFNQTTSEFKSAFPITEDSKKKKKPAITSINIGFDHTAWLGTYGRSLGLYRYDYHADFSKVRLIPLSNFMDHTGAFILSLYRDKENILWIGTANKGIFYNDLNTLSFEHVYHIPGQSAGLIGNFVSSFCETHDGVMWIGTHSGLDKINPIDKTVKHYTTSSSKISTILIQSIFEDRDSILWIGTLSQGLMSYNRSNEKFNYYQYDKTNKTSISNNLINFIYQDRSNDLWIGTANGLNQWNNGEFIRYKHKPKDITTISHNFVTAICEDQSGRLWLGTLEGLNLFDKKSGVFSRYVKQKNNANGLNDNTILSLLLDSNRPDPKLWIGTYQGGLNCLDITSGTFTYVTEKDGLPNNVIYGILPDYHGNLWMSTNKGISKFNPQTHTFRNYDKKDGLQENEFNQGAYYKARDGKMYFGGINGYNVFHPDSIRDNPFAPPVLFTSFKIFNKDVKTERDISYLDELTLSYDDYVFSLEFTALHYSAPEKNQYAYILEGFEKEWTYSGSRRFVNYTNLDPGEYIFRVKGSNNHGLWNETGKSLKIHITPPYWATWWFRTLMVIFFGLVVVFVIQWRKYYKEYRRIRYLSHFKMIRKLGEGGMGEVYQAKNFITGDTVALKLLHPKLTEDETNKTRFLREAKFMSELSHPNIVKIYETGEAAGRGYISMEFLDGMTLSQLIRKTGKLDETTMLEIAQPVCEALIYIHRRNIIHRDLKSENIFIINPSRKTESRFRRLSSASRQTLKWPERIRLMDFGLARSLELMTITQIETIVGTIAYMSPEQASGRTIDHRSDIYSLGVILYEALTGQLPYSGENELVLIQSIMSGKEPKPIESYGINVSAGLNKIVMKMLRRLPENRYQSVDELLSDFNAVNASCTTTTASHKDTVIKETPEALLQQSQSRLSIGDIQQAVTLSATAVQSITKDMNNTDTAPIYYQHSIALNAGGQTSEAEQYLDKAYQSIIGLPAGKVSAVMERDIVVKVKTRQWIALFGQAKDKFNDHQISEAYHLVLDCLGMIKECLLLMDENQQEEYFRKFPISDVQQFMEKFKE